MKNLKSDMQELNMEQCEQISGGVVTATMWLVAEGAKLGYEAVEAIVEYFDEP